MYALVGEGVLQPTAQEIAARAGVALRSVFRHFSDIDSLFASLDARVRQEALPLVREPHASDPLPTRMRDLIRQRAVLFDRIAPYKRSGDLHRGRSAFVRSQQSLLVRELRERLLRWLPELARLEPDLLEAVDLAMSFEAWVRLRTDQRLSRVRATAIIERTVTALLASSGKTRKESR